MEMCYCYGMGKFSKGAIQRLQLHVFQGKTSVQVFTEMYTALSSDLVKAREAAKNENDEYYRRVYLLMLHSFTEAMLFRLKQHLLDQRENLGITITDNEKLVLDEQTVEMLENGTLQRKDLMVTQKKNLKFTLKFLKRKLDLDREPDFGGHGWESYCYSLEKRNSLAHPKFPGDLQIADDDLSKVTKADDWIMEELVSIMNGFSKLAGAKQDDT